MVPALATSVVVIFAAILTVHAQTIRPTEGYYFSDITQSTSIILPLSIVQCEPVLIYYNNTYDDLIGVAFKLYIADREEFFFLTLSFPRGVGYLDWICNIPAGSSFIAYYVDSAQTYTVQPGSSSACLGDITTTYSYASYYTSYFQYYTQHPDSGEFPEHQL